MATATITHNRRIGKSHSRMISDARILLTAEVNRAQRFLTVESRRQHLEAVAREAFLMPVDMACGIVQALAPEGATPSELDSLHERLEEQCGKAGWIVGRNTTNPNYRRKEREKLRKLYELTESGMGGQFRASVEALMLAIDDLHAYMLANKSRNFNDRAPAPCIAYSLPATEHQEVRL